MFGVVVNRQENCTNLTLYSERWSSIENSVFQFTTIIIATINIITNSLSFIIFLLNKRQREPTVRMMLLLLSINEILCNYGLATDNLTRTIYFFVQASFPSVSVAYATVKNLSISWFLGNTFLYARNWTVVLIAVSRCEAVVRPFARMNSRQCCNRCTLTICYLAILTICTVFGALRTTGTDFYLCSANMKVYSSKTSVISFYFAIIPFVFQSAIPICFVAMCTVIMTCVLRQDPAVRATSSGQQARATRMIQILLVVFVSMELPQLLFMFFCMFNTIPEANNICRVLIGCGNLLICLDSTFNFFIYISTSVTFRQSINRMILCRKAVKTPRRYNFQSTMRRYEQNGTETDFVTQCSSRRRRLLDSSAAEMKFHHLKLQKPHIPVNSFNEQEI